MKAIMMAVIGVLFFVSVGGQAVNSLPEMAPASPLPEATETTKRAASIDEIAGTWYSFPAGTVIRFDENGSVEFGAGAGGYTADAWFEGEKLLISFAGYDGGEDGCRTAVGVYDVQRSDDDNIGFALQHDACEWRANILNGHPDLGFDLVFHPVE